jgi:methionine-rich copper-binding protein CopC
MKKIAFFLCSAFFLFLGWSPANAHADLVSSYPQAGVHLEQAPTYVEVKFDGNLITIGKAAVNVLMVKDSAGVVLDDGHSVTKGPYLRVGLLKSAFAGDISVSWRVASDDGHPVEGGYTFSVGAVATPSSSPTLSTPPVKPEGFFSRHAPQLIYFVVGLFAIGILTLIKMRAKRGNEFK